MKQTNVNRIRQRITDYRLIKVGNISTGTTRYYVVNCDYNGYEIEEDDYKKPIDPEYLFNRQKGTKLYDLNQKL